MRKNILCGLLTFGLLLGSAQGAETTFTDVKETDWFAPYVAVCAESGLMKGTGKGSFSPNGAMTVAECAAIAARLLESSSGQAIPGVTALPGQTPPWYQQYVGYLTSNGVTVPEPTKTATRQEFFDLLSAVTPSEQLPAINSITSLPDTGDQHVLAFYNAGILTGTDDYGTFSGDKPLARSEVAAMVARLVKSELRLSFVPKGTPSTTSSGSEGSSPSPSSPVPPVGDPAMTVNGTPISASELTNWINSVAYQLDSFLANYYQSRLDLTDPDMLGAVLEQAQVQAAAQVLIEAKAAQLGCATDALPTALAPSPSAEELSSFVKENNLLCSKHILVEDEQSAQAVLDGLEAQPTLEQFNALLFVFGTDPGMQSNPDGYLFGPGEMVQEFEAGTQALEVGSYTKEPVKSTYGYHIIWRLDPLGHPELLEQYRSSILEQQVNSWLQSAQIVVNSPVMDQIDAAGSYAAYLQMLFAAQK